MKPMRGVIVLVAVALAAGMASPYFFIWYRAVLDDPNVRERVRLEALIESEVELFCQRHGLEQFMTPNDLFSLYETEFADRAQNLGLSPNSLEYAEILTLYSVGFVYRDDSDIINTEPLFGMPSLDKPLPDVPRSCYVDRDGDGWYEIRVPGTNSVYELQGLALSISD